MKDRIFTKEKTQQALEKMQLPKRLVNEVRPFYFRVYNFKTDGLIFLTTTLLVPFICLLIFRFTISNSDTRNLVIMIAYTISNIVGWVVLHKRDSQLLKSSALIFYFYSILVTFLGSIAVAIISGFLTEKANEYATILILIIQNLTYILLAFYYINNLKQRVIQTIKQNWKMLLLSSLIVAALVFAISGPFYDWIYKLIFNKQQEDSNNQSTLIGNGSGIIKAILLIIVTVFLAPLYEEIVYRHLWFTGIGNKTVGILSSALIFAMMHVLSGDVENIVSYFIAGLFFAGIFTIARGNVTYSWFSHMFYNLIAVIILLSTQWDFGKWI